ncbi:FecR family protein [Ferrovibrio sp.]|uniref:FecR family protein n=1 Tax=Ferrovibrio sp. TaxID=1917215 RepID=UPI0025C68889|nr:FecR family protein [Ferrovibrio sp.]MBX3456210.1 FecR domain-containing protein [Ferrovibrio sp.]
MAFLNRRFRRLGLTIAASVLAGLVAANAHAAQPSAEQQAATEQAVSLPAPRVVGQDTRRNKPVVQGQRLVAGPGSGIEVRLADGSQLVVGPNSVLSVDECSADRVVLRLERGSFLVDSANPGQVFVSMPAGSVTVRSAAVAGRVGPDGTDVVLLSAGRADVTGFGGRSVRLDQQGEATRIRALGPPSQPYILPPERLRDFAGLAAQVAWLD